MKNIRTSEIKNMIYNSRKERNLSQDEFGKLFNVGGTAISGWERGKIPNFENFEKIKEFYRNEELKKETAVESDKETILAEIERLQAKLVELNEKETKEFTIIIEKDLRGIIRTESEKLAISISDYVNIQILRRLIV